ncbi:hypothetical protein M758_8G182500 [Ceratodon purpureus]|uniref:SigF-like NTF2-like domain-containing protein n=1 Tax=Ceratodon purpureus TaxID=3225 RepID=A0A8T0GZY2_CERPU|nr:hypothetical protein KC19_8G187200 [Ceratodon purpureus]KAG0609417.1 hypothetical protein M758_8G182500 [Ceratodon purpureus]
MQNPAKEIVDVVRGLVEKPTFERQAAVLRKYFTEDVEFTHYYINTTGGVKDLIAIYNIAECLVSYQSVEFQKITYDKQANALTLRLSVFVRPLHFLPLSALKFLVLLELEDHKIEGGRTVKKIKVQRDYFERAPLLTLIPIIGPLYESDMIRNVLGSLLAATFDVLKQGFDVLKQTFDVLKQESLKKVS